MTSIVVHGDGGYVHVLAFYRSNYLFTILCDSDMTAESVFNNKVDKTVL